jgi:thiamine-phosphate pyrophosphorylase
MLRYYITDRKAVGGVPALLDCIANVRADYIQIREKDLSARELAELTRRAVAVTKTPILVNSRADIARVAGAAGVHLPGGSIAPQQFRPLVQAVAVSCHTLNEVRMAEEEGADFVVFGPVFETPGKGPSVGLATLQEAVKAVRIPVLALGGVTEANANLCILHGAAGIAGIRMFQRAGDS